MKFLQSVVIVIITFLFAFNASAREVIILKKEKSIEKQFSKPNVEYHLRNNINLKGVSLKLPYNSILYGAGNKLSNGTLVVSGGCEIRDIRFNHTNVLMTDVTRIRIVNCDFSGTLSFSDIKAKNFSAAAIYGTGLKDVQLESISIHGYQWGISIMKSSEMDINSVRFEGILNEPIDFDRHIENANYHDAIHISKSHSCNISNISALNCGACVLLGGSSNLNVIENCRGELLWDNGVYISSGHNNIVKNCLFKNVRGSGVKVRGNCNIVEYNSVINVGTGYTITGFGPSIGTDEFGMDYNGYGSIVRNNSVKKAKRYGIDIGMHGGLPAYNCSAINNTVVDCDENGSAIGVFCNNATITGNIIVCPNSFGIVVIRAADKTSGGYLISENNVLCYRKGIVLQHCSSAIVSNNIVNTDNQGIVVKTTSESSFFQNKFLGKGKFYISDSKDRISNKYETLGDSDLLQPLEYIRTEQ